MQSEISPFEAGRRKENWDFWARCNCWGMQTACYFAAHRKKKSDGYFCSGRGKALWGIILAVQHILFIQGEDVVHFLLIWSLTLYFPLSHTVICLSYIGGVYKKWFPKEKQAQTGTGGFIALAVGHLISAQKVMKSLKWPKQLEFVKQFHMPEKVFLHVRTEVFKLQTQKKRNEINLFCYACFPCCEMHLSDFPWCNEFPSPFLCLISGPLARGCIQTPRRENMTHWPLPETGTGQLCQPRPCLPL